MHIFWETFILFHLFSYSIFICSINMIG